MSIERGGADQATKWPVRDAEKSFLRRMHDAEKRIIMKQERKQYFADDTGRNRCVRKHWCVRELSYSLRLVPHTCTNDRMGSFPWIAHISSGMPNHGDLEMMTNPACMTAHSATGRSVV
jgi:hypothetical protein